MLKMVLLLYFIVLFIFYLFFFGNILMLNIFLAEKVTFFLDFLINRKNPPKNPAFPWNLFDFFVTL